VSTSRILEIVLAQAQHVAPGNFVIFGIDVDHAYAGAARLRIEHVREFDRSGARPAQISLRLGFTALRRRGGVLIVDHVVDQNRNQIFRAALRARF